MPSEHILKSFDDELAQLTAAIAQMGALSQIQLTDAINALLKADAAAAALVVKSDLAVDALEREVDARALKVLALRHPIARDLRDVLSALRIAIDFERVCDYAANIAKRTIALPEHALPLALLEAVARLSELAKRLLGGVLEAFTQRDAGKALSVWASDEQLDEAYAEVYQRILAHMREHSSHVHGGTHLLFIAKNIERIGDHATNIAEAVHFMVTGESLDGERPKGDFTALAADTSTDS